MVAVGYNDPEDSYGQDIEDAVTALESEGVKHIFWLTLRAARHPYLTMNDGIQALASRHDDVTVIDWNVYSRSHPDWFQSDGVHLTGAGAQAMATLIHKLADEGRGRGRPTSGCRRRGCPPQSGAPRTRRSSSGRRASPRTAGRCSSARRPACTSRRAGSCTAHRAPPPARTPSPSA